MYLHSIQEVVTMVTANKKYSLLKSTYISDYTKNYEHRQGNAMATEYEYWDRAASIAIVHSYSNSRSVVYQAMYTSIIYQEVVTMVTVMKSIPNWRAPI